jgi:hypothetical protein
VGIVCDVTVTLVSLETRGEENKDKDKGQKGTTVVLPKEVAV